MSGLLPMQIKDLEPELIWNALSLTPGIGVIVTDSDGTLLFVNDTSQMLFHAAGYEGKRLSDIQAPAFVAERLEMIRWVIQMREPMSIDHILHKNRISSTVWPGRDQRVIAVSHIWSSNDVMGRTNIAEFKTGFIDLGSLGILSQREFEVFVSLGKGCGVPEVAVTLELSAKTVEHHKTQLSRKLNISGQAAMVSIVTSIGLEFSDTKLQRLSS